MGTDPTMFQMAGAYLQGPEVLIVTTAGVVWYACRKFSTPTDRLSKDETILPPRHPAVQTTYLRYRLSLTLYVLTWLVFFGGFAFVPDLLNTALVMLGSPLSQGLQEILSKHQDDLPRYLPAVAFALMYGVAKAPVFSTVEQGLRDRLNEIAKIPLEARRMSRQLCDLDPVMPQVFLDRIANDAWSKNLKAFRRGLYDDWVKLRYLAHQIESWPAQPDYSRFDLKYAQERTALLAAKSKAGENLRRLDSILGAEPKVPSALVDDDAQQRAAELATLLCNFTTFLCYGVLASFATKRARNEALQCIGYPLVKSCTEVVAPRPDEEFPLDAAALALLLVPMFVTIALSAWIFTLLPDSWFSGAPSFLNKLGFPGCVRWGFWGALMHFATVTVVLVVRRTLRGTSLRAWLESTDLTNRSYGMYLFCGMIGFVTGGAIAVLAATLGPVGFTWFALVWGSITFVTGASVIWHIDEAKHEIANRYGNAEPPLVHLSGAAPDWRIPIGQGVATSVISMFANLYVLSAGSARVFDSKFCAYLVVATGIVGAFLGQHLHRSFWRRETRKRAIRDRAPDASSAADHPLPDAVAWAG